MSSLSIVDEYLSSLEIPSIPEVAVDLIKTLDAEEVEPEVVAAIIEKDPGITATVLRIANSARYGRPMRVNSVSEALWVLGLKAVRPIALSACVANSLNFPKMLDPGQFWDHCRRTGDYAADLSKLAKADRESSWLAGFLLRVGEVMIGQIKPEAITVIEAKPSEPGSRVARVMDAAGTSEGRIVAVLADRWNFPLLVVNALKHSAVPIAQDVAFFKEAGVVHLADLLSDFAAYGVDESSVEERLPSVLLNRLGIAAESVVEIYKDKK